MNARNFIFGLSIVLLGGNLFGQTNSLVAEFSKNAGGVYDADDSPLDTTNKDGTAGFSWLWGHPDLTIIVDKAHTCPPQYSLSISNANLFSSNECAFLQEIWLKYRVPNTNMSESLRSTSGDGYDVCFGTGGSSVTYKVDPNLRGEDYDLKKVAITNHSDWELSVEQVKHWRLNGLRVDFYGNHGGSLLRFADDKAVGDWFDWDPSGNLRFRAKFNNPYPFFEHLVMFRTKNKP